MLRTAGQLVQTLNHFSPLIWINRQFLAQRHESPRHRMIENPLRDDCLERIARPDLSNIILRLGDHRDRQSSPQMIRQIMKACSGRHLRVNRRQRQFQDNRPACFLPILAGHPHTHAGNTIIVARLILKPQCRSVGPLRRINERNDWRAVRGDFQLPPADFAPTAAVSFTINHIAAVGLPAPLGYLWLVSPGAVFSLAAAMAAISFLLATLIPRSPVPGRETRLAPMPQAAE